MTALFRGCTYQISSLLSLIITVNSSRETKVSVKTEKENRRHKTGGFLHVRHSTVYNPNDGQL